MSDGGVLVERLAALEELQRVTAADVTPPLVCTVCFFEQTELGCPCGRRSWAQLTIAIITLQLALRTNKQIALRLT